MACLATAHLPAPLIIMGTPYLGQDWAWAFEPWAGLRPEAPTCPGSLPHAVDTPTASHQLLSS